MFNVSIRKVGGLTWVRLGRLTLAFNVAREFRPIGAGQRRPRPKRYSAAAVNDAWPRGFRAGSIRRAA